jgi:hypothetical protein
MKLPVCLAGSLLLGASLTCHAQSGELPATPRFYGGLGVYTSSHQTLGSWYDQTRIPVEALVGYQFRPRVAVQLGLGYSGNHYDYAYTSSYSSYYPPPPSTIIDFAGRYTERSATATLLARYTLTRKPAHLFQADLLGGTKFEYSRYNNEGTQTTHDQAAPVASPYSYTPTTSTQLALSLGFGLRYRLVSRLEVAYNFTFDKPVATNYNGSSRMQSTSTLGLRYHFGHS